MILRLGKRLTIDGNFVRAGRWEIILVPRPYAAVACHSWIAVRRLNRHTYVFLGPRVLTIRRRR